MHLCSIAQEGDVVILHSALMTLACLSRMLQLCINDIGLANGL